MAAMKYLLITALTAVVFINGVSLFPFPKKSYRLNNKVIPTNYEIELTTNIKKATFEGVVNIKLTALEATDTIRYHADVDLDLTKKSLVSDSESKETIEYKSEKYVESGQFWEVKLKTKLKKDEEYKLTIIFNGKMKDNTEDSSGYYLLKYKSGKTNKVIAVTQFEPIFARKVFPCFDEPDLKATFDIKLKHDKAYTAYSNSNGKTNKDDDADIVTTVFQQTPEMSTYLVAFALVSDDFEEITADKDDKRTKILLRKDIKDQFDNLLLSKTTKYLKALESITGVEYEKTLDKITHLSIPNNNPRTNGMENWGLIVYGENGMTYDESIDPFSKKFGSQRLIAHELSHQWFGNLVTPKWWTDLWLKEGFASYFEYIVMDVVEPGEYGKLSEYLAQVHHKFFKNDSSINGRAMDTEVEKPDDIVKSFDVVQYEKGGQLLHMLEHIIGSDVFADGIKNYVKNNQYNSVTPDDLWNALQESIDKSDKKQILDGKKVADIGKSWSQAGYPVVHVTIDADKGKLKFTQKRFLTDSKQEDTTLWLVPINYITNANKNLVGTAPMHWLENKELKVDLKNIKFVIANNEQTGYYRVNYDTENWKAISDHLYSGKKPKVSTITQAQLLDDAFTFVENGDLQLDVAIELTRFLEKVDEFLPWKPISTYLINIYDKISMTTSLNGYQAYLSKIVKKAFKKVSFDGKYKKNVDGLLQEEILPLIVRAKSPEFIAKSEEIMNDLKDDNSAVLKKFQRYVFCGAANKETEYLIGQLKEKESEHNPDDIVFGLSCLSTIDDMKKVLKETKDKKQKVQFIKYVAEINPLMVYEHTAEFKTDLDEAEIQEIISILAVRVGTEEQLKELKEISEESNKELVKKAEENCKWNKDNQDFHDWVGETVPTTVKPPVTSDEPETSDPTTPDPSDPTTPNPSDPTSPNEPETTPGDTDSALNVAVCFSMLLFTALLSFLM